eukprot:1619950-Rhodomonas_salina.3
MRTAVVPLQNCGLVLGTNVGFLRWENDDWSMRCLMLFASREVSEQVLILVPDTDLQSTLCSRKFVVDQHQRLPRLVNVDLVSLTRHAHAVRIETNPCFSDHVRPNPCASSSRVCVVAPQNQNQNGRGTEYVA